MHKTLEYPFDGAAILMKRKKIKRELLEPGGSFIDKRIAILGGSTTHDICDMLELFLLNNGIRPVFYESEYNRWSEEAVFSNAGLENFRPDIIFIHTTNRNITEYPAIDMSEECVNILLDTEYKKFTSVWEKLAETYVCPIIQNNFEYMFYRLLGNRDSSDYRGRINFINRLNFKFYEYTRKRNDFYINDINWLSADYGLEKWSDPFYWHMYKYALAIPAIPHFAHNLANIIKSIFGKNKKAFVLDLDNTLWGGIVGEDGVENIQIGQDIPQAQVYAEFQEYIKAHKKLGILLNIASKNDADIALAGLRRPDSILSPEDFAVIKANWEPKDENIIQVAKELSLLPESFVFVDDNPAEREIVTAQVSGISAPKIDRPERYISVLDKSGFFEVVSLSEDDLKRGNMYMQNAEREADKKAFSSYGEYLASLEMKAGIKQFDSMYIGRISQLTNKTNQFNLTTERYTYGEIERIANSSDFITLYGRLTDKFGDNGVVSAIIGEISEKTLHIRLWLMSCRILKRNMEHAMADELIKIALGHGISKILGYYYPTAKNKMVSGFYTEMGFSLVSEDGSGSKIYSLLTACYAPQNKHIKVNTNE